MIDIPAETTISRYAIPALNLLMRCEASFPAPTPKERSAPPPTRTSLDVVVNHRRGRKCESDAGSLPLHVFYKKPCEPVIERPDLLVATAWPPGNSDGALEARFPGMGTQDHAGATDALRRHRPPGTRQDRAVDPDLVKRSVVERNPHHQRLGARSKDQKE